mgnify:CR=1 FL=1
MFIRNVFGVLEFRISMFIHLFSIPCQINVVTSFRSVSLALSLSCAWLELYEALHDWFLYFCDNTSSHKKSTETRNYSIKTCVMVTKYMAQNCCDYNCTCSIRSYCTFLAIPHNENGSYVWEG